MRYHSSPFLLYLAGFFAAWTACVAVVYPRMLELGPGSLRYALLNVSLKSLVWIAPVLLYLRFVDQVRPLEYLKLTRGWKRGVGYGLVIAAVNLVGAVLRYGIPDLADARVTWNGILSASLAVGVTEEIVFRGFVLQKLWERHGFGPANVVSSALFLLVHLPGWTLLDGGSVAVSTSGSVFLFSLVMAWALKRSGSLWACIVAHNTNDFLSFVLFGL